MVALCQGTTLPLNHSTLGFSSVIILPRSRAAGTALHEATCPLAVYRRVRYHATSTYDTKLPLTAHLFTAQRLLRGRGPPIRPDPGGVRDESFRPSCWGTLPPFRSGPGSPRPKLAVFSPEDDRGKNRLRSRDGLRGHDGRPVARVFCRSASS